MPHTLPELPWAKDALAPVISQETIEYHYGKHHAAYVNKLNELIAGKPLAELPLEEVVKKTWKQTNEVPVFNNAAQVWNHTFYWNCLSPKGGGEPSGKAGELIAKAFGVVSITSPPSAPFTSHAHPLPKRPTADVENFSLKVLKSPNDLSMAALTAPVGSPPPFGERQFQ